MPEDDIKAYIDGMENEEVSAIGLWNGVKAKYNGRDAASSLLMEKVAVKRIRRIKATIRSARNILNARALMPEQAEAALRERQAAADRRAAAEWERRQREGGRRPRG